MVELSGSVLVRVGVVAISTTCINAKRMGRWRLSDRSEHIWRLCTNAVIAISNVTAEYLRKQMYQWSSLKVSSSTNLYTGVQSCASLDQNHGIIGYMPGVRSEPVSQMY